MRCEKCHGVGHIRSTVTWDWFSYVFNRTCEDCGGSGLANCCEGLQEQPEGVKDVGKTAVPADGGRQRSGD